MHEHELIPDEVLDVLADGRAHGSDGPTAELGAFLGALRAEAAVTPTAPSASLQRVLAEGITPATQGILTAAADGDEGILTRGILTAEADRGILTRGILTMGRLRRVAVTQFAALGLLAKSGVAMAAVGAVTTGAGAAGVLPTPAQDVFDAVFVGADEDEDVTPTDAPADDTTDAPGVDGEQVSQDATGASDGEPGVDGGEVADDASQGRSTAGQETAEDASDGRSTAGREQASELPDPAASPGSAPAHDDAGGEDADGEDHGTTPEDEDGDAGDRGQAPDDAPAGGAGGRP